MDRLPGGQRLTSKDTGRLWLGQNVGAEQDIPPPVGVHPQQDAGFPPHQVPVVGDEAVGRGVHSRRKQDGDYGPLHVDARSRSSIGVAARESACFPRTWAGSGAAGAKVSLREHHG